MAAKVEVEVEGDGGDEVERGELVTVSVSHSVSVYLEMATLLLSSHSTCYYRWNYSGPLHHLHQHSETSTRERDW